MTDPGASDPVRPAGAASPDATPSGARHVVALDEVLMTLLVELLYFLDTTPRDKLDPRLAERMTQEAAFQLSRVAPEQLEPFVTFIRTQAEASAWPAEREFLRKLPGHLGWE